MLFRSRLNELTHKSYDYYFKIIPHLFDDKLWGEEYMAYQYSITSKMKEFDANGAGFEMPIIMLNYDFSPITMKITREPRNLLHGLTQICAIVGGVFILFNLLNRILLTIFESDHSSSK